MKKKESKEKEVIVYSKFKFPSIYRIITEQVTSKWVLIGVSVVVGLLIAINGYCVLSVFDAVSQRKALLAERSRVQNEISYWEGVSEKYPGYRDSYFQLALRNYQLGNKEQASMYLQKVFVLDPNYDPGRKLEEMIRK